MLDVPSRPTFSPDLPYPIQTLRTLTGVAIATPQRLKQSPDMTITPQTDPKDQRPQRTT